MFFNQKNIEYMETIYLNNEPCHTYGTLPAVGTQAPCFNLCAADLSQINCDSFKGKRVVFNIFPSLDTEVCAMSVRKFNEHAANMPDTVVVCVSMDLPFAMKRFCVANGIENVVMASAFRQPMFAKEYGVLICDGPLAGLLARSVLILDKNRTVIYRELVSEITHEPDYDAALSVLDNDKE